MNKKNYYGYALDLPKDDKRRPKYKKQRKERGFDDTETWSLNMSWAGYFAPRLRRLIEIQEDFIKEPYEDYFNELKSLADACERYNEDCWDEEALKTIREIFPKVSPWLWW